MDGIFMEKIQKRRRLASFAMFLDKHLATVFIIPAILCILGLIVYPAILTIYNSMTNLSMLTMRATKFVGLDNYITVLKGSEFWVSLWNSLVFTVVSIAGQFFLGLTGALALQRISRGKGLYRIMLLVPWTFPSVAMTFLWDWLLDSNFGIVNYALMSIGLIQTPIAWFGNKVWAMPSVIAMNVWFGFPFMLLSLSAGLQTIPSEYYEVGLIEGIGFFQELKYIVVPALRRIIGVLLILRTIWVFNNYDFIFLTTGGGPSKSTQTVSIMAYFTAWKRSAMGRGSAITILLLIFVMLLITLYFKLFGMNEESEI